MDNRLKESESYPIITSSGHCLMRQVPIPYLKQP